MLNLNVKDFDKICRICLKEVILKPLYENSILIDMLKKVCTKVEFDKNDALPKNICAKCTKDTQAAFRFITKCKTSDTSLRECLALESRRLLNFDITEDIQTCFEEEISKFEAIIEMKKNMLNTNFDCTNSNDIEVIYDKNENLTINDNIPNISNCDIENFNDFENSYNMENQCNTTNSSELDEIIANVEISGSLSFESNSEKSTNNPPQTKFSCSFCQRDFTSQNQLDRHCVSHPAKCPFACHLCRSKFPSQQDLGRHITCVHPADRPFRCKVCELTFSNEADSKRHENTHYSNISCTFCKSSFENKTLLKRHLKIHVNERMITCHFCGLMFREKTFRRHERIHTGEKLHCCQICGKKCVQKYDLLKHMRTHNNERPYACDMCHMKFKVSSHLVTHKRLHTGERFCCNVCGKDFTRMQLLQAHKQKCHDST